MFNDLTYSIDVMFEDCVCSSDATVALIMSCFKNRRVPVLLVFKQFAIGSNLQFKIHLGVHDVL